MKVRKGFVSNSSSSSFVVPNLSELSEKTIDCIVNYDGRCYQFLKKQGAKFTRCGKGFSGMLGGFSVFHTEYGSIGFGSLNDDYRWSIEIDKDKNCIILKTDLDNFNMKGWLKHLGVEYIDETE